MFGLSRFVKWTGIRRGKDRRRLSSGPKYPGRCEALQMEELEDRCMLSLLGQQIFPADNPWNQNISNAPLAANSATIIAHIGASVRLHPDWGADNATNGSSPLYGIPFNVVHGNSTAKVNVVIDNYPGESDIVPVPIPQNAVVEGDYQNGPNPNGGGYSADQRGDSHLIVWDEDNNVAYELYGVTRPSDPTLFPNTSGVELPHTDGQWHAAQETFWNMNTDSFRTLGATSADAAGLSILAGLVRPDEGLLVSQGGQGAIDHALRMTLPAGDVNPQYVYPASHMVSTSQGANNLPLGSRLRLANTPAIDSLINTMPPESQIIARAMQQYGLILADIGSAMYVTGSSASVDANNNINLTWDMNDIFASNGLETLTAGDFQVVTLAPIVTGLSPSSAAPGNVLTITGQNFSGAAGHLSVFFGTTPATSVTVISDTQLSVVVPSGSGTVDVTVQSGVNKTDNVSDNPNANVNAPIFGYGTSTTSTADRFTYGGVAKAATVTVSDAGGTYNGSPFPATALVNGATSLEGVSPTFTYYAGSTATGNGSTTAPTAVGTYTVVASFAGSTDYAAAQSAPLTFTISKATPAVTASDAGGTYDGSPFPATALVNGATSLEGVSPTFTYYAGSTATGNGSTTAPTAVGTYTVVASFAGSTDYAAAQSAPATFTITAASKATPTVTLTISANPSVFGQSVTFQATVAASSSGAPTGTVTFSDGSTALGTGTLSTTNGVTTATFSTSGLAVGSHTITASYNGNASFSASTSAGLTQTINKDPTTIVLTSSRNPSASGQRVTLTVTVSANAPGSGMPTGTVTFKDGAFDPRPCYADDNQRSNGGHI